MKLDHKLREVALVLQTACDFVVAFVSTAAAPAYSEPEAVTLLATLWAQKMHQRELTLDAEIASHVRRCFVPIRMISVTCPEALMGLSAMVFYKMRSRDYPSSA